MMRLQQDIHEALRKLGREPAFAALSILTLALGIGANSAIFSVIATVLLRPLPYGDPDRIAMIWNALGHGETTWLSAQEIVNYGRESQSFEAVSAYADINANLTGGTDPERVRAAAVKPDIFTVLQVQPIAGRPFTAADGSADSNDVAVLGHGLWQRRFGGSTEIIGQQIQVNGRPRTVIGVMPAGFRLPLDYRREQPSELWVPLTIDPANPGQWGDRGLIGLGRLRADATMAAATSEMDVIGRRWVAAGFVADQGDGRFRRSAVPVRQFITGSVRTPLVILFGTVVFVLLVALANVANLSLARAGIRERELAIRAALGATRRRLVGGMLTESVVLALCGGALGIGLAHLMVRLLTVMHAGTLPRIEEAALSPAVLGFTTAVSLLAGILFGIAPALQWSRPALSGVLQETSRASSSGRSRLRMRGALVVLQMTLSVVLVLGAGLLTRSLMALNRIDLGFDTSNLLTAQLQLPVSSYPDAPSVVRFYRELEERLRQLPGVRAAGAVRILPLSRTIGDWSITIEGKSFTAAENPNGDFQWATPGYFEAMGIRARRGRLLTAADSEDRATAVVINDTMAARWWPGEDVIGKRFHLGTAARPWMTIVGIVPTIRHNAVVEEPRSEMYLPHAQVAGEGPGLPRAMTIVIKTESDPRGIFGPVRDAVRAMDRNLPISDVRTMAEVEAKALAEPRLTTWLLGGFALLALTLAAVGIYGTISLVVNDRAREIGIRLALGAQRRSVLGMVLWQGTLLAGTGITLGVAASLILTRFLDTLVYGVSAHDPLTFFGVPLLLSGVAFIASLIPARRAATLDPVQTLRR